MNRQAALLASATRLAEIQAVADQHGLPDHHWAEEILRGPDGVWAQAYRLSAGRVSAVTEVVWVPRSDA